MQKEQQSKNLVQAVIFDIDGTLVDSVDLHAKAWQDAFRRYGKKIDYREIRDQIGRGGDQILPLYLTAEEIEKFGDELIEFRGKHFKSEYIHQVKPFPHVRELFAQVKSQGKKIALGSSAASEELSYYKELARVTDLVDAETSADDADKSKPAPDIFAVALNKLVLPANATMVVGDSPYDAEAARKLSIETIGFLCGGFSAKQLKDASAIALYGGPQDLLAKYNRSPLAA